MSSKLSKYLEGEGPVWGIYVFLCILSLVEVFSAASTLTYKSATYFDPLIKQAAFLAGGTVITILVANIPCKFFRAGFFLWVLSFAALIAVFFVGKVNGGARWIPLGPINFQPSELAKCAVIITVALFLSLRQQADRPNPKAMKHCLWTALPLCALIAVENLSTAIILFGTVFLMMWVARVSYRQLGKIVVVAGGFAFGALFLLFVTPDSVLDSTPMLHRATTWKHRIAKFGGEDTLDATHTVRLAKTMDIYDARLAEQNGAAMPTADQLVQRAAYEKAKRDTLFMSQYYENNRQRANANIAIASSHIRGKFFGNSDQRDYLPQAFSDFIFAIIVEELGIVGTIFVVLLYLGLLLQCGRIAARCERRFPAYLVMGLGILLTVQALAHIYVCLSLGPVTGQPLPLISRGGTSTLFNCLYFGIILSVSRYARACEARRQDRREAAAEAREARRAARERTTAEALLPAPVPAAQGDNGTME